MLFRLNPVNGGLSGKVQIWNIAMTTLRTWHVLNMVNVTSILTTAESPVPIIPITAAPTPQGEDKGGTDPRAGSLNNSQTLPTHCFTRDSYFRLLSCASTDSGWLMNSNTPPPPGEFGTFDFVTEQRLCPETASEQRANCNWVNCPLPTA